MAASRHGRQGAVQACQYFPAVVAPASDQPSGRPLLQGHKGGSDTVGQASRRQGADLPLLPPPLQMVLFGEPSATVTSLRCERLCDRERPVQQAGRWCQPSRLQPRPAQVQWVAGERRYRSIETRQNRSQMYRRGRVSTRPAGGGAGMTMLPSGSGGSLGPAQWPAAPTGPQRWV